ncbi:MAG: type II and III secretion system protein family protein [Alphaproteobacteria bacterium]
MSLPLRLAFVAGCLALATQLFAFSVQAAPAAETAAVQIEIGKGKLIRLARPAATVFVADPTIADIQVKSPKLVYVFGNKAGQTTLFAVDNNEQVLADLPVTVTHDLSRLNDALKSMLHEANVEAESVDGALVLNGTVESAAEAENARHMAARFLGKDEQVINRVSVVGPNQITLRVRMAEVSRDALKQFGFNWDAAFLSGSLVGALGIGNPVLQNGVIGAFIRNPDSAVNNLGLGVNNGNMFLNTVIDALAAEGLVSILAEPNLTAVSGETANFLAGGEFPVPVPQTGASNSTSITVEFKKFGVSLAFTPTLLEGGRISLKVIPEVSQLSDTGAVTINSFQIPALTTRRAETTVELGSGQSFAIAGLFQNDTTHNVSKFPGLGDLPVLGPLFRSDKFRRQESELVIIVTPYIVRPISEIKMAAPTDGLVAPNDYERIIQGRTYRPQLQETRPGPVGPEGSALTGPSGFVLE